jgi:O-antigen/teichoic acid export membrane protein
MIALIKITRILQPTEYGIFTFLIMQGGLLITIGDLGVRNINIRTIARDPDKTKNLVYNGIKLRLIVMLASWIIYLLYNYLLGSLDATKLAMMFLFALLNCLIDLLESVAWGYQKMKISSMINVGYSVIWLALVLFLPASPSFNVNTLFLIYTLLNILKLALFIYLVREYKLIRGPVYEFWSSAKKMAKEGIPYFGMAMLLLPITFLSNNFLDINSTKEEIGYFNLAVKLISPINLVLTFALSALFPNLATIWVADKEKFIDYISKGTKVFILFISSVCFFFTLFCKEIITLLFSKSYLPAIKICQLQAWYYVLMGVNSLIGTSWGASDKEKIMLTTTLVNCAISTPLLYWGSKYGALGMCYAYIISFAIFEIYLWNKFKRSYQITIKDDYLFWFIALLMFCSSYFLLNGLSLWWRAVIFLGVVGLLYGMFHKKIKFALYKKNMQAAI